MTQTTKQEAFYALLIGIDYYAPNVLPNGNSYRSLKGCVRDLNHVEDFLRQELGLASDNIIKLTSSKNGLTGDRLSHAEPPEQLATYENMVASFKKITDNAKSGDQVYIHYSGHGARAETIFPGIEGKRGLDESLVPMDIGNPSTRYLRDVEIAYLLNEMIKKDLIVTVVLDACHSGGISSKTTRGRDEFTPLVPGISGRDEFTPLVPGISGRDEFTPLVRGVSVIDRTKRPSESLAGPREDLISNWKRISPAIHISPTERISRTRRDLKAGAGWLPEPNGYVLLSACQANESAYEFPFDGKESNGALTYWLLESLKDAGQDMTFRMLHNRIAAKVHGIFKLQTPQLEGEGHRIAFSGRSFIKPLAVNVTETDLKNNRIRISAGLAHNMREGVQFAVYPSRTSDFGQIAERLAIVEINEPDATWSWAKIIEIDKKEGLEEGAQATLIKAVMSLRSKIDLVEDTPGNAFLQEVEAVIKQDSSPWVEIADKNNPCDFQVAINADGVYKIMDPAGLEIPRLFPLINIKENRSADRLVQQLAHLTKYRNVKAIETSSVSPLRGKLTVEVRSSVENPSAGPGSAGPSDTNRAAFKIGQKLNLSIKNLSTQALNITVLNLTSRWGIKQIFPTDRDYELFESGRELTIPLTASIPPGQSEGFDIVKVFATREASNFRWLELPNMVGAEITRSNGKTTRAPQSSPRTQVAAEGARTRDMNFVSASYDGWTIEQREIRVIRED